MWTRENFTDLQYIIAESTRLAIFEWSPALCRLSSVTSETARIPPDKSCYPCSAAIYIYICKVKFTLEQATKAQRGSTRIALLFL